MKKYLLFGFFAVMMIVSCTAPKTLYSWSNYSITSYNYLKNMDDKSKDDLLATYKKIIDKQTGTRQTVPPGVYADYGFLLIQTGKTEEGVKMLKMEATLYPESSIFVSQILKKFEK